MRSALPLLLAGAWLLGALSAGAAGLYLGFSEMVRFKSWMLQHRKAYSTTEYQHRLQTFANNRRRITAHNAKNHTFQMGINPFSDMTFAEFKHKYLWSEPQNCSATKSNYLRGRGPYPSSVDWRKKGPFVSKVKNQGGCGSCWTFSTTGALESAIAIKTGKFQPEKAVAFVKDVANITLNDEEAMVEAVALYNPVSFAFEVTSDFMMYRKGIYSSTSCHKTPDKVNHAVLAVGYGEENGKPYWIVKNSWGPQWGMNGYFLIERGKNMCGLAACASYPIPQL
uniref:Cathepsin H n=1 Tax=Pipistrellus kuhlii TaxID=59472 RepID=A0A7J7QVE0_PIPKU|nr:cathepsin H [Pipistrellus kuhlii]